MSVRFRSYAVDSVEIFQEISLLMWFHQRCKLISFCVVARFLPFIRGRIWSRAAAALTLGSSIMWAAPASAQPSALGPQSDAGPRDAGRWIANAYGSSTFGFSNGESGDLYLGHLGMGYYFWDNISINLEFVAGGVDPDFADTSSAVGFDLIGRWHFFESDDQNFSVFLEGGAGMLWTDDPFPAAGTHQNFTPQAGLGLTWDVGQRVRLLSGVRWHHISNADKTGEDRNPGYDGVMVYAGFNLTF